MTRNPFRLAPLFAGAARRAGRARSAPARRNRRRRRPRPAPAAPPRPSTRSARRRRSTRCAPAATRSTPRSPRPACSASTEPFSAGIGGGGFMVIRTARRQGDDDRRPRDRAREPCAPDSFFENGAPLPSTTPATAASRPACPAPSPPGREALRRYGTFSLRERCSPGSASPGEGFTVDQTFVAQTQRQHRLLRRRPVERGDLPRPRRHAARRRQHPAQPRHGTRLRADRRSSAPRASTGARSPTRWPTRRSDPPTPPTPTTCGGPA